MAIGDAESARDDSADDGSESPADDGRPAARPAGASDAAAVTAAAGRATALRDALAVRDPLFEPMVKDRYGWESYKREHYDDVDGNPPRDEAGEVVLFDPADALGFDPDLINRALAAGGARAAALSALVDERTVEVDPDLDEDAFFSTPDGHTTLVNRYDLEKAVPVERKRHFREIERYWVNEPHSFVVLFHSRRENKDAEIGVSVEYWNDSEPSVHHRWTGTVDAESGPVRVNCAEKRTIEANLTSDDVHLSLADGSLDADSQFDHEADDGTVAATGTPLRHLVRHYFAELAEVDSEFVLTAQYDHSKNRIVVGRSATELDYRYAEGKYITYLHVTENDVRVALD